MFVIKPATGKRVLDPATKKAVPAEGTKVEKIDTYWHRRLQDKDVVLADEKLQAAFESGQLVVKSDDKKKK